jgi:hypothetical protein
MLPMIPKPAISRRQKAAALVVAGMVDFLQIAGFQFFGWGILSPLQDALDFVTALVLVAICGFKWQLAVAFLAELLPVAAVFPTWTALVLMLPTAPARSPMPPQIRVAQVDRPEGARPEASREEVVDVEGVVVPPVQEKK